jgi:hypothetical protein
MADTVTETGSPGAKILSVEISNDPAKARAGSAVRSPMAKIRDFFMISLVGLLH